MKLNIINNIKHVSIYTHLQMYTGEPKLKRGIKKEVSKYAHSGSQLHPIPLATGFNVLHRRNGEGIRDKNEEAGRSNNKSKEFSGAATQQRNP